MYDSRSNHPRGQRFEREGRAYRHWLLYCGKGRLKGRDEALTADEAIAEGMLDMEPEPVVWPRVWTIESDWTPTEWEMDEIQREALGWLEDHAADIDLMEQAEQEIEARAEAQWEYLHGGDGYDVDGWMPVLTMTEVREHFGPDFEHNGFQIDSTNAPRRTYRKAPTMHDYERAEALMATQKQRLAALMPVDEKAKVTRALPVPHAERPEPTPYDKFAGRYNEALDPISPNFDRSAW